jgi:phosphomevalonate kinase
MILPMKPSESALRAIKDRISMVMGEIEDTASEAHKKLNHWRLSQAARELHACADEMQNLLMRVKTR